MTPMKLNRAYPVAALHDYVRRSGQREADIQGAAVAYSIAARPDQILEFYLRQPYMFETANPVPKTSPQVRLSWDRVRIDASHLSCAAAF
jgi:hypothetical protein